MPAILEAPIQHNSKIELARTTLSIIMMNLTVNLCLYCYLKK